MSKSNIKQLVTEWKWNGMELANPFLILIRLVLHLPIIIIGNVLWIMLKLCGYDWQADALRDSIL